VLLLAGAPADSARPFGEADVRDAAIVVVHPLDQNVNTVLNSVSAHASTAGARIVMFVGPYAAERWARLLTRAAPERWALAENAAARDDRTGLFAGPAPTADGRRLTADG
jgi:hypothetical protein